MHTRILSILFLFLTSTGISNAQVGLPTDRPEDRAAVRAVVEKIFQGFVEKNPDVLRATHSQDWAGYFTDSKSLSKGIDKYMEHSTSNWGNKDFGMLSYKFNEFEINFVGDVAVVFYVADVTGKIPPGIVGTDKYRSIDIYAKRNGNWIQIASNLNRHPDAVAVQASLPFPVTRELKQRILAAREAVWRAWFTNDQATLEKMIPDEVIGIENSDGKWANKAEILAGAKQFAESGGKLVRLEFPRTEIQMYGKAITLYTSYLVETEVGGQSTIKKGVGTETLVMRNDSIINTGWLLADASK
jgi:hypothetical protein